MQINMPQQIAKVLAVQKIDRAAAIEQIKGRIYEAQRYLQQRCK